MRVAGRKQRRRRLQRVLSSSSDMLSQSGPQLSASSGVLSRLLQYISAQNQRPADNNIGYWTTFVEEYFTKGSVLRLGVKVDQSAGSSDSSSSGSSGQHAVLEAPTEAFPRLFQIKFENGLKEELLFLGDAQEMPCASGGTVLVCGAAVEECVYEAVRVQRHGELRVTFTPDLKIAAYEFNLSHTSQYFSQSFVQEETEELLKNMQKQRDRVTNLKKLDRKIVMDSLSKQMKEAQQLQSSFQTQAGRGTEHGYERHLIRGFQVADVVNSLSDLFAEVEASRHRSPVYALQSYANADVNQARSSPPLPRTPAARSTISAPSLADPQHQPTSHQPYP